MQSLTDSFSFLSVGLNPVIVSDIADLIQQQPNNSFQLRIVTRCNFSCNLQRNSTHEKCKIGKYASLHFENVIRFTYPTNYNISKE